MQRPVEIWLEYRGGKEDQRRERSLAVKWNPQSVVVGKIILLPALSWVAKYRKGVLRVCQEAGEDGLAVKDQDCWLKSWKRPSTDGLFLLCHPRKPMENITYGQLMLLLYLSSRFLRLIARLR